MPNREWKKKNKGERWQKGETLITVIGQGFMLATPLQIANMTAILASGKKIKPKILYNSDNIFENTEISHKNLTFIREAMYSVVNEYGGTAYSSRLNGKYKLVGKTGTSQVRKISKEEREIGVLKNEEINYKLRDHSIFTGFAPYDKPKFAITVVAEHMGSGSKVAAPIAKKIINFSCTYISWNKIPVKRIAFLKKVKSFFFRYIFRFSRITCLSWYPYSTSFTTGGLTH